MSKELKKAITKKPVTTIWLPLAISIAAGLITYYLTNNDNSSTAPYLEITSHESEDTVCQNNNTVKGIHKEIAENDSIWVYVKPNTSEAPFYTKAGVSDTEGDWTATGVRFGQDDQKNDYPFYLGVFAADEIISKKIQASIKANKKFDFPKDRVKARVNITVYRMTPKNAKDSCT